MKPMRVLQTLHKDCGISYQSIAETVRRNPSTISNWSRGSYKPDMDVFCKMVSAIKKRSRLISQFRIDNQTLREFSEDTGIPLSFIARQVGISKQAIHQFDNGEADWPPGRKKQVEQAIRQIGRKVRQAIEIE